MNDDGWMDRMNAEYEAATTDAERLAVLRNYMSEDMARGALAAAEDGATSSVRDEAGPEAHPAPGRRLLSP